MIYTGNEDTGIYPLGPPGAEGFPKFGFKIENEAAWRDAAFYYPKALKNKGIDLKLKKCLLKIIKNGQTNGANGDLKNNDLVIQLYYQKYYRLIIYYRECTGRYRLRNSEGVDSNTLNYFHLLLLIAT